MMRSFQADMSTRADFERCFQRQGLGMDAVAELHPFSGRALSSLATVGPYTSDFSKRPTQSEMRTFRDWCNNFFGAAARQ